MGDLADVCCPLGLVGDAEFLFAVDLRKSAATKHEQRGCRTQGNCGVATHCVCGCGVRGDEVHSDVLLFRTRRWSVVTSGLVGKYPGLRNSHQAHAFDESIGGFEVGNATHAVPAFLKVMCSPLPVFGGFGTLHHWLRNGVEYIYALACRRAPAWRRRQRRGRRARELAVLVIALAHISIRAGACGFDALGFTLGHVVALCGLGVSAGQTVSSDIMGIITGACGVIVFVVTTAGPAAAKLAPMLVSKHSAMAHGIKLIFFKEFLR
jgi:hypothetical protein